MKDIDNLMKQYMLAQNRDSKYLILGELSKLLQRHGFMEHSIARYELFVYMPYEGSESYGAASDPQELKEIVLSQLDMSARDEVSDEEYLEDAYLWLPNFYIYDRLENKRVIRFDKQQRYPGMQRFADFEHMQEVIETIDELFNSIPE